MEPGKIIFSYQCESRITGGVFGNRGSKITSQVYKGGIIFCDESSSKISAHHQVQFTSEYTIISNLKFEREAMGLGVPVESYSTYNGIYTSKEFTLELHEKGQVIRHNILGGHHYNGGSRECNQ